MAYDQSKDKVILEAGLVEVEGSRNPERISVFLVSYDGHPAKVQVQREYQDARGNWLPAKLGRLGLEEARMVAGFITSCVNYTTVEVEDDGIPF